MSWIQGHSHLTSPFTFLLSSLFFNLLIFFPFCQEQSPCYILLLPFTNSIAEKKLQENKPDYQEEKWQWEVCWRVCCFSAFFFFTLFCISGAGSLQNYISQTPLPVGFLLSLACGNHSRKLEKTRSHFFPDSNGSFSSNNSDR